MWVLEHGMILVFTVILYETVKLTTFGSFIWAYIKWKNVAYVWMLCENDRISEMNCFKKIIIKKTHKFFFGELLPQRSVLSKGFLFLWNFGSLCSSGFPSAFSGFFAISESDWCFIDGEIYSKMAGLDKIIKGQHTQIILNKNNFCFLECIACDKNY